jgi:hypothetical protein
MTGPILQRPEGIRRKEIAVTATKTTRVSIVNAIALGITVGQLLGSCEGTSLAEGEYLLNWPFLRLTDRLILASTL